MDRPIFHPAARREKPRRGRHPGSGGRGSVVASQAEFKTKIHNHDLGVSYRLRLSVGGAPFSLGDIAELSEHLGICVLSILPVGDSRG